MNDEATPHENVTTDLTDDEIALIVKGLWAVDGVEPGVPELIKKLGFGGI